MFYYIALKTIDKHMDLSGDHAILAQRSIKKFQLFYEIPMSDMAEGKHNDQTIGDMLNGEC